MIVWWKRGGMLWDTAQMKEAGILDHTLYAWARKSYGGYDGQMRLWIGGP